MPQIFSICHKSSISSENEIPYENCFKPRILHVINKLTHQVIYEVYSRGLFENHVSFNSSSLFKTLLSLFNKLSQEPRWLQTIIFHIIAFQCSHSYKTHKSSKLGNKLISLAIYYYFVFNIFRVNIMKHQEIQWIRWTQGSKV